jgi:hypothetical protein
LIGLLVGLAGGVAVAFLLENMDSSFKTSEEINTYVNVPLLATLPALITRGSVLEQRRAQGLLALASIGTVAIGIICVRILAPIYF